MIYAPVIIPTLNRFSHFQQCLESLENCTGASQFRERCDFGFGFTKKKFFTDGHVDKWNEFACNGIRSNKLKTVVSLKKVANATRFAWKSSEGVMTFVEWSNLAKPRAVFDGKSDGDYYIFDIFGNEIHDAEVQIKNEPMFLSKK